MGCDRPMAVGFQGTSSNSKDPFVLLCPLLTVLSLELRGQHTLIAVPSLAACRGGTLGGCLGPAAARAAS